MIIIIIIVIIIIIIIIISCASGGASISAVRAAVVSVLCRSRAVWLFPGQPTDAPVNQASERQSCEPQVQHRLKAPRSSTESKYLK